VELTLPLKLTLVLVVLFIPLGNNYQLQAGCLYCDSLCGQLNSCAVVVRCHSKGPCGALLTP